MCLNEIRNFVKSFSALFLKSTIVNAELAMVNFDQGPSKAARAALTAASTSASPATSSSKLAIASRKSYDPR
jgi:hypothetical protein